MTRSSSLCYLKQVHKAQLWVPSDSSDCFGEPLECMIYTPEDSYDARSLCIMNLFQNFIFLESIKTPSFFIFIFCSILDEYRSKESTILDGTTCLCQWLPVSSISSKIAFRSMRVVTCTFFFLQRNIGRPWPKPADCASFSSSDSSVSEKFLKMLEMLD